MDPEHSVVKGLHCTFCQRGSNSYGFFLVDEGREDNIPLKAGHNGPSGKRHLNAI